MFICLGIGFLSIGILMIYSLKKNFEDFYIKVKRVLWAATLLLAIPMFLRAINWVLQISVENYKNVYENNIAFSNAIYCLLTTIFPVVT